ncbi:hypothetical protein M433DRAFT_91279 [Acidomyces richmondensis BFW]|nr:MAG: hypothetical protein FE78DRAFT_41347 [Acidomyces sp. 'richmondensis']KYG44517.1 hypothetical protein M433DRAFT_91279 [Acidomyces richmondensis BFW]
MAGSLLRGTAFITGAGSGIGQFTAYSLAKYGVDKLVLCDIASHKLEQTTKELEARHKHIEILQIEMDVSREAEVNSAVEQTVKRFGRIDIGVNNAGIGEAGRTDQLGLDKWQKVLSVDLDGVWLCQRAQIRQMLRQEPLNPPPRGNRGVIINVASMLGLVASSPGTPAVAYTAAKHGVMGLTRTDAVMYAPQGIRINAICPGYIATPLIKAVESEGVMAGEISKVPQNRLGEPEEIGDMVALMASPMASFMTGAGVVVDGGYTAQ